MYPSTQSIHPLQTIFGGSYVPELHDDERHPNLLPKDKLDFAAILKSRSVGIWRSLASSHPLDPNTGEMPCIALALLAK